MRRASGSSKVTTIAFRNGVFAADSQVTVQTDEGGSRKFRCEKLYRKETKDGAHVIIATAGESSPSLIFVDWYGSGKRPPKEIAGTDFTCLVLRRDGLFEYDGYCRGDKVLEDFYAIGSGAKAALGAMHMGATAEQAVEIACRIDPYSAPPIVTMRLE